MAKIMNNEFTQENGLFIEEGVTYKTAVGELAKIEKIDVEKNEIRLYNISGSCRSWHRVDCSITENKFREIIRGK